MALITLKITGNPQTYTIDWTPGLDIQSALEMFFYTYHGTGDKFDYAVQYYGYGTDEYLGYMIIMVDDLFQNIQTAEYWFVSVNNQPVSVGIDSYVLSPGATLGLNYQKYDPGAHQNTHVEAIHNYYHPK
jgi:Domain of unknown function (DUF4430)